MLGVHPQTISNYAESGIIHLKKRKGHCFFPLPEVEALAECPDIKDAEQIKKETEQMISEIKEKYTLTKQEYAERRSMFYCEFNGTRQWFRYREIVSAMVHVCCDTMTDRERDIIEDVLNCKPIEDIADYYLLSCTRVRMIIQKCIRKMKLYPVRVAKEIDKAKMKTAQFRDENDKLKMQLQAMLANKNADVDNIQNMDTLDRFRMCAPFNIPLSEVYLSVRAFNCLKAADINTLGELVSFKRTELMKFRNFGRKSLCEIDMMLDRYKLDYEMWRDPQRKY